MAKKFSILRDKMSSESQALVNEKVKSMLSEMPLDNLRYARMLSLKLLADILGVEQSSILETERLVDMYLAALRSQINAMGGDLEIIATFPEGLVKIERFSEIAQIIEGD